MWKSFWSTGSYQPWLRCCRCRRYAALTSAEVPSVSLSGQKSGDATGDGLAVSRHVLPGIPGKVPSYVCPLLTL